MQGYLARARFWFPRAGVHRYTQVKRQATLLYVLHKAIHVQLTEGLKKGSRLKNVNDIGNLLSPNKRVNPTPIGVERE